MSLYLRKYTLKSGETSLTYQYDFEHGNRRYRGSFGHVTPPQAEAMYAELMATVREQKQRAKAKALEQRLGLTLRFEEFAEEYLAYCRVNAQPRSVERHESAYRALRPTFGPLWLSDITPYRISSISSSGRL